MDILHGSENQRVVIDYSSSSFSGVMADWRSKATKLITGKYLLLMHVFIINIVISTMCRYLYSMICNHITY